MFEFNSLLFFNVLLFWAIQFVISILLSNEIYLQELENIQVCLKFMHIHRQKYTTNPEDHHEGEELSGDSGYEFTKFRFQQSCLQVK